MFFMTWPDEDDPLGAYDDLRGFPGGSYGYVPIAEELGAPLAPVGWAFRQGVLDDPLAPLWKGDGHHGSTEGNYLAACVLYTMIYGTSASGLWHPGSISETRAAYLQQLAADTVFAEPEVWFP